MQPWQQRTDGYVPFNPVSAGHSGQSAPGGTVSGPVLITVADVALYVAILGEIGIVPLAANQGYAISQTL